MLQRTIHLTDAQWAAAYAKRQRDLMYGPLVPPNGWSKQLASLEATRQARGNPRLANTTPAPTAPPPVYSLRPRLASPPAVAPAAPAPPPVIDEVPVVDPRPVARKRVATLLAG